MSKVKQNWVKLNKTEPNLRKLSKISSDSIPSLIYGVLIGLQGDLGNVIRAEKRERLEYDW